MYDKSELMDYAIEGNVNMINMLIPSSLVRSTNKHGFSALMYSAAYGHYQCVKALLIHEQGLKDNNGKTALMHAASCYYDRDDAINEHIRRDCCASGHNVALSLIDHIKCVKFLIPFEKKTRDLTGKTALMHAARNGNPEIVKLLIRHEVGLQDRDNKTALMYAAENGNNECVISLMYKEAKKQDYEGMTALMHAAKSGQFECVETLIPHEAKLWDENGKTALMHAAENGNIECVKILIHYEAKLLDKSGKTAIMYAAENNYKECVKALSSYEEMVRIIY